MDRREFVSGVALGLLAAPLAAEAQPAEKVPRIDYVSTNLAASPHLPEAFRQGLRDLGYVEDRNVVIEYRSAEGTRPDAIIVPSDPEFFRDGRALVDLAAQGRTPTSYEWREFVEIGGLMSYGPNREDLAARVAGYVDSILKGTKPADLPVEQPTKFELVINLKAAEALGLTIPPSLLLRADEVIQ